MYGYLPYQQETKGDDTGKQEVVEVQVSPTTPFPTPSVATTAVWISMATVLTGAAAVTFLLTTAA